MSEAADGPVDVFIIGGGVNGCGIARDAAGRGLRVALAERRDLGWATSSASTKLFHGGLRYLEYFEFRLVREALIERETLLRAMPHISWPMRFVLPYHASMRFESDTPTSRLLSLVMPWMKGRRPAWLIRLGLFLYDHLGGRKILPGTSTVNVKSGPEGAPLNEMFQTAYEYSDCWVDDARLVALNARDARRRGARIMTRCNVDSARRKDGLWEIALSSDDPAAPKLIRARALVNASGPWAGHVVQEVVRDVAHEAVRLVRGSHIVTRKLYDHDKCYFFQGTDGRIAFAIPYERDFTLIGTTDAEHADPDQPPVCTEQERDYLCAFVSRYFKRPISAEDVVWSYSGVRPLYDDGVKSATAATRDYTLKVAGGPDEPPLLNVFGGKITTYRRLAESALARLAPWFAQMGPGWTAGAAMPGGDFPVDGVRALKAGLRAEHPFLTRAWAMRLVRAYGTDAHRILGEAKLASDLGRDFGATLTEAELRWMVAQEFVRCGEDALWRRSKLGLRLSAEQALAVDDWIQNHLARQGAAGEAR